MSLGNDFNMYKEEIELVRAQSRVECDLYSIIASVMRERNQANEISLRDVSARRKTVFSKSFIGDSGFPDFVIRTRVKTNEATILGAVEVKYVGVDLDLEKHLEQLENHLKRYRRVIYTDGLKWRYYDKDKFQENWEIELGKVDDGMMDNGKVDDGIIDNEKIDNRTIHDRKICWFGNENWAVLLEKLDTINWNDKR